MISEVSKFWNQHINDLKEGFEPILENESVYYKLKERLAKSRIHYRYFPGFVISVIIILDLFYVNLTRDLDAPRDFRAFHDVITNFIEDHSVHDQVRNIFYCVYFMTLTIFFQLISDPMVQSEFLMCIQDESMLFIPGRGETLSTNLSKALIEFRRKTRKIIRFTLSYLWLSLNSAYSIPLVIIEIYKVGFTSGYQINWRHVLISFICPLYLRYFVHTLFVGLSFMFQNLCLHIMQRYLLGIMEKIIVKIEEKYARKNFLPRGASGTLNIRKQQFGSSNGFFHQSIKADNFARIQIKMFDLLFERISTLVSEIHIYNRFYQAKMTANIIGVSSLVSYLLYGFLIAPEGTNLLTMFCWIWYVFFYSSDVVVVSGLCSKTIRLNVQIFKKLLKLAILSGEVEGSARNTKFWFYLDRVNRFKVYLSKTNFKLLDSVPINNKFLFFQLIGYVGFIFMKLFQKANKQ